MAGARDGVCELALSEFHDNTSVGWLVAQYGCIVNLIFTATNPTLKIFVMSSDNYIRK
jgi:hypothetical protein